MSELFMLPDESNDRSIEYTQTETQGCPIGQVFSKIYLSEEETTSIKYTFPQKNAENLFV